MIPVLSREALEGMRRADVLTLCTENGTRANLSTTDLIDLSLHASTPKPPMPLGSAGTMPMQETSTGRPRRSNSTSSLVTTAIFHFHPVQEEPLESDDTVAEGIAGPNETAKRSSARAPSAVPLLATENGTDLVPQKRKLTKEMQEDRRHIELEEDAYATNLKPASVQCTMCLREIRLDNRANYKGSNWKAHRRSCKKIKAAEDERMRINFTGPEYLLPINGPSSVVERESSNQLQSQYDTTRVNASSQRHTTAQHNKAVDVIAEPSSMTTIEKQSANPGARPSAASANNKKHYLTPVPPKRQSEFLLFQLETLADLKAKFPGILWNARKGMVSRQWAAMSKADKEVYKQRTFDALAVDSAKYNALIAADAQDISPCTSTNTNVLSSSQTYRYHPEQGTSPIYYARDTGGSAYCLQQNPMPIAMGPDAQCYMDENLTTDILQVQNIHTTNSMDVINTQFMDAIDFTDMINVMHATNNTERTDGMTQMDGMTNHINDMATILTAGQTQTGVSLGHSVTIVLWFQPYAEPRRFYVEVPTFPHFALSGQTDIMSGLGLTPLSLVESYDRAAGHWTQQTPETIHFVESEQRLLIKVRQGLQQGLNDHECPSLQNEIAWVTYSQGILAPPPDMLAESALSDAADRLEVVSGEYANPSDDIYQYLSLPDDSPEGTPPPPHPICDTYAYSDQDIHLADFSASTPDAGSSTAISSTVGHDYQRTNCVHERAERELTLTWEKENMYTADANDYGKHKGKPALERNVDSKRQIPKRPHPPPLRRWPFDFTVSEVTRGFHRMRRYESLFRYDIRREAFEHVFGCEFVLCDFQRHYESWQNADPSLRSRFEAMEDGENAMWGAFEVAVGGRQSEDSHDGMSPVSTLSGKTRYMNARAVLTKPQANMAYYRHS